MPTPTAADIPLHVYEVLEEEYISLHGPLPADEVTPVELPAEHGHDSKNGQHTRDVDAARDWRFRRGHVKDPVGLAVGRIRYSDVDLVKPPKRPGAKGVEGGEDEKEVPAVPARDGLLLYIKPAVYGDEPLDVLEYKKTFPAFPHQSTADQFFDEPQFESYRGLGSHIMDQLCGADFEELSLRQVIANARARALERCEPPDADFLEWLWGLTGETPPAARPKRHPPVRRHRVRPDAG